MKQLYYGNDYYNGGYKILACSDGIPKTVLNEMIMCAENISETTSGDYGLIIKNRTAILYCNSIVLPRNELGEQRRTYFSHQYYIGENELDSFVNNMPSILENIHFLNAYSDFYDTSDVTISSFYESRIFQTELGDIAKEAILNGYNIIAYCRENDREFIKKSVAETASGLSFKEREEMSFVICGNAKDKRLEGARLIFCNKSLFTNLQEKFYHKCIYFNMDTGEKTYSADIKIKKSTECISYAESEGRMMYNNEYNSRSIKRPDSSLKRKTHSKANNNLLLLTVLLSIILIVFSRYATLQSRRQLKLVGKIDILESKVRAIFSGKINELDTRISHMEKITTSGSGSVASATSGLEIQETNGNTEDIIGEMEKRIEKLEKYAKENHGIELQEAMTNSEQNIETRITKIEERILKLEEIIK